MIYSRPGHTPPVVVTPSMLAAAKWSYHRVDDLKATDDRVIVRPARKRTTTHSGLFISPTAEYAVKEFIGEVLSVGPRQKNVSIGDIVLYRQFAGTEIQVKDNGEYVVVIPNEDLYAVIVP